ncbi:MAG TPA: hypothetical protein EYH06_09350 [Chromatiales bacterium]|nr:hypothetical protein [Thiotrichales bacterium]HIP68782.1 hypothetical protein [Chromatiales bacterium]
MGKRSSQRQKLQIAQKAASLIVEEGFADYQLAKRKACERLGLSPKSELPRNQEVEQAVLEYQRLFAGDGQQAELQHLRRVALAVMKLLGDFEPRLVGSVLKGTANALSDIHLHVFSDDARSVAITFLNAEQNYQSIDRRLTEDNPQGIPGFRLLWEGAHVEILVFPYDGLRAAPPSPVDGKPMRRANVAEVSALLEDESSLHIA